jgi:hypothetical protein
MTHEQKTISVYAHDYRDMKMNEEELTKMLWAFWRESEKQNREAHIDQFCATIDSFGFKEWYHKTLNLPH